MRGQGGRKTTFRVLLEIIESSGRSRHVVRRRWARIVSNSKTGVAPSGAPKELHRTTGALAHAARVTIMLKLLEGPATYRSLQKTTSLKAGPLYHHINQLRLCGLILPKQRDLYELTRGGQGLILAGMAVAGLARDRRRCLR